MKVNRLKRYCDYPHLFNINARTAYLKKYHNINLFYLLLQN